MKRRSLTFLLITLVSLNLINAENGYIKFLKDTSISGKHFSKNDSCRFISYDRSSKIYTFLFKKDTFRSVNNTVKESSTSVGKTDQVKDQIKNQVPYLFGIPDWIIYSLLGLLGIIAILFILNRFLSMKKSNNYKRPIIATFNHNSLTDFVRDNKTSRRKVIKYNEELSDYNALSGYDKEVRIEKLIGKVLIVEYKSSRKIDSKTNINEPTLQQPENKIYTSDRHEGINISSDLKTLSSNIIKTREEIVKEVLSTKEEIVKEINRMNSTFNSKREIDRLTDELKGIKKDKSDLEVNYKKLKKAKDELDTQLDLNRETAKQSENNLANVKANLEKMNEKILFVDFLSIYLKSVLDYLILCNIKVK